MIISLLFILHNLTISSFSHCPHPPTTHTFQTDPMHTSFGTTGMPWALVHDDVSCCINVLTVRSGAYGSLDTSKLKHLTMLEELHIDAVLYGEGTTPLVHVSSDGIVAMTGLKKLTLTGLTNLDTTTSLQGIMDLSGLVNLTHIKISDGTPSQDPVAPLPRSLESLILTETLVSDLSKAQFNTTNVLTTLDLTANSRLVQLGKRLLYMYYVFYDSSSSSSSSSFLILQYSVIFLVSCPLLPASSVVLPPSSIPHRTLASQYLPTTQCFVPQT